MGGEGQADGLQGEMTEKNYNVIRGERGVPIKAWTRGVPLEDAAERQLRNVASLPFVYKWVAAMPDVHWGIGATVGSVIPTQGAIMPAAVGVDIGCGMMAVETSLDAKHLPDNLHGIRSAIERAIPHGRTDNGGRNDRGAWRTPPAHHYEAWAKLNPGFEAVVAKHPKLNHPGATTQLGTLGTGNHFIEVCLDEVERVWFLLHSGSRGVGNRIGTYFINVAKKELGDRLEELPDKDLAWLKEGRAAFADYIEALKWAQSYALVNRQLMMGNMITAVRESGETPGFRAGFGAGFGAEADADAALEAVNCHHNYVAWETHYGEEVMVTRKGAVRARRGDLGIIPGSMGARSYIVAGKGNPESFESCSHGAGRAMSRTEAKRRFTVADHERATAGVECRKDAAVIDETPMAYKNIDAVMEAQKDLVEVVHTLRQVVCVKG